MMTKRLRLVLTTGLFLILSGQAAYKEYQEYQAALPICANYFEQFNRNCKVDDSEWRDYPVIMQRPLTQREVNMLAHPVASMVGRLIPSAIGALLMYWLMGTGWYSRWYSQMSNRKPYKSPLNLKD